MSAVGGGAAAVRAAGGEPGPETPAAAPDRPAGALNGARGARASAVAQPLDRDARQERPAVAVTQRVHARRRGDRSGDREFHRQREGLLGTVQVKRDGADQAVLGDPRDRPRVRRPAVLFAGPDLDPRA